MNILELIVKEHPQVAVQAYDAAAACWTKHPASQQLVTKRKVENLGTDASGGPVSTVRGLQLKGGERIVVRRAAAYWPTFRAGDGYFYAASNNLLFGARLKVGWVTPDGAEKASELRPTTRVARVGVPEAPSAEADLVIEVPRSKGNKVFLGVHRVLDRTTLYRQCVGTGVEIGPGPRPQILPTQTTSVKYVEQATPDEWERLYGRDSRTPLDKSLWEHYVVGNADSVPASPASLDFIFSSHVVEHLGNPLGHLAYWCTLLKPGGKVLAVIPDRDGCKDFVFPPSTIEELLAELAAGDMKVGLRHYERWLPHRMPKASAQELMDSGRSIHAHFYTPDSMEAILRATYARLGFSSSEVTASANHKDFFITLVK